MARVAIVGDGPAGLSAALLLAKNDVETVVFAQDGTAMHHAHLFNYLGIEEIGGSEFQATARRQVTAQGAELRDAEVTTIDPADGDGFVVRTADGELHADYVILAGSKQARELAAALGVERDGRVPVDTENRTEVDRLYAVGRVVRPERSQAIISAGAGAVAALDILSREAGKDVHDWDTPPKE